MEGTSWLLSSKKNVIQKLLGQVNVTYVYSHANTHFCIEILFEVFLIPKLANTSTIYLISFLFEVYSVLQNTVGGLCCASVMP